MSTQTEQNKELYRRWIEEAFNKKDASAAIDRYLDPNMIDNAAPPGFPQGLEGQKQLISGYLMAFPDLRVTIEDVIAEGDKVVARFTVQGTHQGEFWGIAPTGRPVTINAIDVVRVANGKFVEHWAQADFLGLLQQLGALPAPGQ